MYGINHLKSFFKLEKARWKEISDAGTDYFKAFPLADDPDFLKLKVEHQRFLMAYTLKDLAGFHEYDCYKFAYNLFDENRTVINMSVSTTRLKKHPIVKKLMEKIDWMRIEAMGFTAQRIIEEETALAYSDITDFLDADGLFSGNLKNLPGPVRRTIKEFEIVTTVNSDGEEIRKYKLKLWDKGASLSRMQKVKGMHTENLNVSGGTTNLSIKADADPKEAADIYKQMLQKQE